MNFLLDIKEVLIKMFGYFFGSEVYKERNEMPTSMIAKTILTLVLTNKFKDDISTEHSYQDFDGTKLPPMSGHSLLNALSTYIDHGCDKTEAIEKFIDKNLRTPEQLQELIDYLQNKLK